MKPPVPITVIKRRDPDLERFAAALLALAIARVEAEEQIKDNAADCEEERG